MKWIELSTLAPGEGPPGTTWGDLELGSPWTEVVDTLFPGSAPTDAQVKAIGQGKLLTSRRNLVVGSATNSGKSLLGYLALFRGILSGKRALLLEPLRAVAQEKYEELLGLSEKLAGTLGKQPEITITTGDYRLNEEQIQSPPPEAGELVIATPERIEAILRNPGFDPWMESFGVVVVDEAHLLGDRKRGATLEYVLTSMKLLRTPPRCVLLSATMGNPAKLAGWLEPCDVVTSEVRRPPLERRIRQVTEGEEPKGVVEDLVRGALEDPERNVLIFVYQTQWADKLAMELNRQENLKELLGSGGALAYHSRLSAATREQLRRRFETGESRCVVTTAALAMGVNLPATDVIVRDLSYGPGNPLENDRLFQMAGRAGRGNRPGRAIFVVKDGHGDSGQRLREKLESGVLPEIRSALIPAPDNRVSWNSRAESQDLAMEEIALSLLARAGEGGLRAEDLEAFLNATLEGHISTGRLEAALRWLSGYSRMLAWQVEKGQLWRATVLGERAIRSSLPLPIASGVAQLIRDILSLDAQDRILRYWREMDLLLLAELTAENPYLRVKFSERLAEQVDDWMERSEDVPYLFREWVRGQKNFSKAEQILGSLGIDTGAGRNGAGESARQKAYLATFRAIVLWQRAKGTQITDVERRWKISDLAEIEEGWRDDRIFLLGGLQNLWEIRCFYFHLKEECQASKERVQIVKRQLQRLAAMTFQLTNLVSWCSPLGPFFLRLRRAMKQKGKALPGRETMRLLESQGFTSPAELRGVTVDQFREMGLRRDLAEAIVGFVRR